MKRAVLDIKNIEKCIENGVYVAPLSPSSLSFSVGEKMYVAMRKVDAKKLSILEYVYLFTMGKYLGEKENLASKIYGRRNKRWKHFWNIKRIDSLVPFSLDDLVDTYAGNKDEFRKRYRGENLVNKTVTDVENQDEKYFRDATNILDTKPSGNIEEDLYQYQVTNFSDEAEGLTDSQIAQRLKERNKQNKNVAQRARKQKRLTKIYKRDPQMGGLLQRLYKNKCQVCGDTFIIPSTGKYYSEHHHITPVSEDGSNEYKNIVVVCSTCHKKLDRGYLKIDIGRKKLTFFSKQEGKFKEIKLKHDRHLFVNLP